MKAIATSVNGRHICTAGVRESGLIDARVRWGGAEGGVRSYHMFVGAINHETKEKNSWHMPEIGVGDEVTLKILEAETVDPPDEQHY
ncbi:MAG: hypothetical protein KY475_12260 [Planctomycetes bacterium]|nr:hypothetical protein [Planctomycetota bacterium]